MEINNFPNINLSDEFEKDFNSKELIYVQSLSKIKSIIAKLSKYSDFSESQIDDIVYAASYSIPIYWEVQEDEIKEFLTSVIYSRQSEIDRELLEEVKNWLEGTEQEIPF